MRSWWYNTFWSWRLELGSLYKVVWGIHPAARRHEFIFVFCWFNCPKVSHTNFLTSSWLLILKEMQGGSKYVGSDKSMQTESIWVFFSELRSVWIVLCIWNLDLILSNSFVVIESTKTSCTMPISYAIKLEWIFLLPKQF